MYPEHQTVVVDCREQLKIITETIGDNPKGMSKYDKFVWHNIQDAIRHLNIALVALPEDFRNPDQFKWGSQIDAEKAGKV